VCLTLVRVCLTITRVCLTLTRVCPTLARVSLTLTQVCPTLTISSMRASEKSQSEKEAPSALLCARFARTNRTFLHTCRANREQLKRCFFPYWYTWRYMTLGRCPLSIFCSRGTPPRESIKDFYLKAKAGIWP